MTISNVEIGHGLSLHFDRKPGEPEPTDVWLAFKSSRGKSAMLSVVALSEREGRIIGGALREWAADRILEFGTVSRIASDWPTKPEDTDARPAG